MRFSLFLVVVLASVLSACVTLPSPTPTYLPEPPPTTTAATPAPSGGLPLPWIATPTPRPQVLRINIAARPDLLDPQKASLSAEIAVLQLAYEGLTRVDEKGRVQPAAAERWEFTNGGKSLTFHLRAGLKRADGTPLTAKDFEYAFRRALDPRIGGQSQPILDGVRGALTAYSLDPKTKPEDIEKTLDKVGVKATDDLTLVVTFDQPTGFWTTIASTWIGFPSDRNKVDQDPDAWWLKPDSHNGNGPFKIIEIREQVIRLTPNPNYRNGAAERGAIELRPYLDRIELYWQGDAAALESYRKGELEIVRVSAENLAQVQADPVLGKELVRAPAARVTYLGFNVKKPPFGDKNVRVAFSYALDREGLVRDVLKGLGKPYLSWIPPGIPGYDETANVPAYDAQAAVQTLIGGGYGTADKKVDCAKLGTIKLSYSNTPKTQLVFRLIAENLTRVFACQVLLDPIEPGAYTAIVRDPKTTPQMFLIPWEQECPHPQNWLFLQTCAGVYAARLGYCNREFDAALAAANAELDFDKAMEKYKAAQKIFVGDVAAAFLWNNENAYLVKPYARRVWDSRSTSDSIFPGQFGPVWSYTIGR